MKRFFSCFLPIFVWALGPEALVAQQPHLDLGTISIGAQTARPEVFFFDSEADALKGTDATVLVKNPVNPDIELWIGALERINGAGIKRLAAVHRGFSSYEKKLYRNAPMWQIPIELHRRIPALPIFCDPSHIGGRSRPCCRLR